MPEEQSSITNTNSSSSGRTSPTDSKPPTHRRSPRREATIDAIIWGFTALIWFAQGINDLVTHQGSASVILAFFVGLTAATIGARETSKALKRGRE